MHVEARKREEFVDPQDVVSFPEPPIGHCQHERDDFPS